MLTIEGKASRVYEVKKVSVWGLPWRFLYKSVKYILGLLIETRDAKIAKYNSLLYEERVMAEIAKIDQAKYEAKRKFYNY